MKIITTLKTEADCEEAIWCFSFSDVPMSLPRTAGENTGSAKRFDRGMHVEEGARYTS